MLNIQAMRWTDFVGPIWLLLVFLQGMCEDEFNMYEQHFGWVMLNASTREAAQT